MSFAEQPLNIAEDFLSVAEKFDKTRGPLDDTNRFFSCNGYGVRKRQDFFHIYNLLTNFVLTFRDGRGE